MSVSEFKTTTVRLQALGLALAALAHGCSCGGDVGGESATPCADDTQCPEGTCDLTRGVCLDSDDEQVDPQDCGAGPDLCSCGEAEGTVCQGEGQDPNDSSFDVANGDSNGVGVNPDGELILDSAQINTHVIWIANTQQGSVSRVDTRTFAEEGRYQTTPLGLTASADPSRTTVNLFSDVYVGNRAHKSVTKISVLGDRCPDRNGDGVVTTSTGPSDIKPWTGDVPNDECILWHTQLPADAGIIRAMAAQEVVGLDGALSSYVWVGGWNGWVYKLDGQTGEILFHTESPVPPYGFALDAEGNLWISTLSEKDLGRLDTTRCTDEASCGAMTCTNADGVAGDACVKQRITRTDGGGGFYGITVDRFQNVWLGGSTPTRYDPSAAWGARWTAVRLGGASAPGYAMGVAATKTFAFLATGSSIVEVPLNDPTQGVNLPGAPAYGIAVDFDGKVWGIPRAETVTVITPGNALGDVAVEPNPPTGFVLPYTYSDMTGSQARLATTPRGYYRTNFVGCAGDGAETAWGELRFVADTPAGTSVVFRARTAASEGALASAEWVIVASLPGDASPADLGAALTGAGISHGPHLEIEIQLVTERFEDDASISPTVSSVAVTHSCDGASVVL